MIDTENKTVAASIGLHEVFASATRDASAAMCRWTDGVISVTLDEVRQVALEDISTEMAVSDEPLTIVILTLDGELGGSIILMFDEVSGRQLAASLLGNPPSTESEWTDLEKSALMETGNILGCAYVNALTRLIGRDLHPSPPCFVQDFAASVLEQALMTQAVAGDDLLLCDIGFHRHGEILDWRVVFVPTPDLRTMLGQSLDASSHG